VTGDKIFENTAKFN